MSKHQAKNWIFTINNYTDEHVAALDALHPAHAAYLLFGFEKGEQGTPHLQGYVQFNKKIRHKQVCELIPHSFVEVAKGDADSNYKYCTKDGDFKEYGTLTRKRQRNDLEAFKEAVKEGTTNMVALREEYTKVCAMYPTFVRAYINDHRPKPSVQCHQLNGWQQELMTYLKREPNDREIVFVVDKVGNSGKSWFCKYYSYVCFDHAQILEMGKKADVALTIDPDKRVYFFDLTREHVEHMNYSVLESLKNARIFSPKYESHMVHLSMVPHVVVMMNQDPDMSKLSLDRYKIIKAD